MALKRAPVAGNGGLDPTDGSVLSQLGSLHVVCLRAVDIGGYTAGASLQLFIMISNQVGSPAELKHINKRRKRN
jgi:hypothetical protein